MNYPTTVSVPFLLQQKVSDIPMLNSVAAHIIFVQGDDVFGIVIANTVIDAKLPLYGIFRGQQVCDLYIQLLPLILTHKVDLLITHLADGNGIAPA